MCAASSDANRVLLTSAEGANDPAVTAPGDDVALDRVCLRSSLLPAAPRGRCGLAWRTFAALVPALIATLVPACSAPPAADPGARRTVAAAGDDAVAKQIERDPVGYLRDVLARCEAMSTYKLTFYRQERLGLFGGLGAVERIQATFRAKPYSVRFEWPEPESYIADSCYVEGENDGKLIVRERHGWMGFPPTIRKLDPYDPVRYRKSKRPITDFGLAQLMQRTLATIDDPPLGQPAEFKYHGIEIVPLSDARAHAIVLTRAATKDSPCTRQDLWIDEKTRLPAGTRLVLPDGRMDSLYVYENVQPNVAVTDADFRITAPAAD